MITALCGYFSGTFVCDTGGTFKSDTPGTFVSDIGGTFEVILSIGGTVCYNLSDNSIDGIIYSSYILLMLGSLSGLTLFFIEFGFKKFDKEEIGKGTLWLFFLLFVPIGIAGILNYKLIELINPYSNKL